MTPDRIIIFLLWLLELTSTFAFIAYASDLHDVSKHNSVSPKHLGTRVQDASGVCIWLLWVSVFMSVAMAFFHHGQGKRTEAAHKNMHSPPAPAVFWDVLLVALSALIYFADFAVLGVWAVLKWTVRDMGVHAANDCHKSAFIALIIVLSSKTLFAVIVHAWAIARRRIAEDCARL